MNNKGTDQTARMRRLICGFIVPIWQKQVISWHCSNNASIKLAKGRSIARLSSLESPIWTQDDRTRPQSLKEVFQTYMCIYIMTEGLGSSLTVSIDVAEFLTIVWSKYMTPLGLPCIHTHTDLCNLLCYSYSPEPLMWPNNMPFGATRRSVQQLKHLMIAAQWLSCI